MPMRILLAVAFCLGFLPGARADVHYDLDMPAIAATIDGEPLSQAFVDVMHRIASKADGAITRDTVVQALIDDRLAAAHARATAPAEALIEQNKVGFSADMQVGQAMVSSLQAAFRPQLEARLRREKGGTLNGLILAERAPGAAEWSAVIGDGTGLRLEYGLDAAQRAAAAKVVLLRYRLGRAPGQVSLLEVYDAQNVQGRNQLHARNAAFAIEQARQLLKQRYILHWARSAEGLGETDFAVFRRAMEDRLVHGGWMAHLGVAADLHDAPQHLKDLQAAVTRDEIRAYYAAHRDEFRRIEKVKARHIRVAYEARARDIEARLQQGESFAALARQFSTAPDAASGGDLGWIEHGETAPGWLESVAFLQQPGVVSRPLRTPGAAPAWEILLVEERAMSFQPEDSESVRYQAGQAIAKRKALQEYRDTLARLRHAADIRLPSPAHLKAGKPA